MSEHVRNYKYKQKGFFEKKQYHILLRNVLTLIKMLLSFWKGGGALEKYMEDVFFRI